MKRLSPLDQFALIAGRGAAMASRLLGRGSGGMIGGKVASAISPQLLKRLAGRMQVVLVTGTNGKSTTTKMIRAALHELGPVASNKGGDNMLSGVTAALIEAPEAKFAVLEVDEMHLPVVAAHTHPAVIVLLNLSRDQIDRVGEISVVEARLRAAVDANPQAVVVANCDDPLIVSAAWGSTQVQWVGAGVSWTADAVTNPRTGAQIVRDGKDWYAVSATAQVTAGSGVDKIDAAAGVYGDGAVDVVDGASEVDKVDGAIQVDKVDGREFRRPEPAWYLEKDKKKKTRLCARDLGLRLRVSLSLPGRANKGNAAQAVVAAYVLGAQVDAALQAIGQVQEVAGRYATFDVDGRHVRLLLAKNPAGWQEAMSMLNPSAGARVLAVNGRVGDGLDMSWLQDVNFADLPAPVIACGERRQDLHVCLEAAGIEHTVVPTPADAIASCPHGLVDYLANYTAFYDLYTVLCRPHAEK